jgi:arylsulfatase A-like enzyme
MNRREFLKRCSLAAGSVAALGSGALAGGVKFDNATLGVRVGGKRYNVLFVLVDQWRFCSLSHGAHHDKLVHTPNLDKLAKQGAHWSRCYAAQPVCTPNRSAIITGRFPHETGMYQNDLMLPPSERCLSQDFTDAGYNCHYIGKWHMNGGGKTWPNGYLPKDWHRRGFTTFEGFNRGHNYWYYNSFMMTDDGTEMSTLGLYPSNTYEPTFQTDFAINFIKQNKNHPFFCYVSWGPPHTPYNDHPADISYDAADVVARPNVTNVSAAQSSLDDYFAHCTALDIEFGRLMDTLEKEGLADNTLVVFTSDHGDAHYSHGLTAKNHPEEESSHIPLLMRLPDKIKPGTIADNLFSSVDLMPTILSLCGLSVPDTCTGKDKSAAMFGGMPDESIYVIGHWVTDFWRMVLKDKYKLVIRIATPNVPSDLYDLEADPYELTNLIDQPAYAAVQTDLWNEYQSWYTRTGDVFPDNPEKALKEYPDPV